MDIAHPEVNIQVSTTSYLVRNSHLRRRKVSEQCSLTLHGYDTYLVIDVQVLEETLLLGGRDIYHVTLDQKAQEGKTERKKWEGIYPSHGRRRVWTRCPVSRVQSWLSPALGTARDAVADPERTPDIAVHGVVTRARGPDLIRCRFGDLWSRVLQHTRRTQSPSPRLYSSSPPSFL